jgi:hypothetical protein
MSEQNKLSIGVDFGAPDRDYTALYLKIGGSGMHIPDPYASELVKLLDQHDRLKSALRWYIENDDVNIDDPENQFYIDGFERAKRALNE